MAKRNKIPESILKAPRFTPLQVVTHTGLNRQQRRRLAKRLRGSNTPYRKTGQDS